MTCHITSRFSSNSAKLLSFACVLKYYVAKDRNQWRPDSKQRLLATPCSVSGLPEPVASCSFSDGNNGHTCEVWFIVRMYSIANWACGELEELPVMAEEPLLDTCLILACLFSKENYPVIVKEFLLLWFSFGVSFSMNDCLPWVKSPFYHWFAFFINFYYPWRYFWESFSKKIYLIWIKSLLCTWLN